MTVWSKYDFDLAATRLGIILCQMDLGHKWSFDNDCLVVVTTRETEHHDDHHVLQSSDSVSFDGDTIVYREVQTTDWYVSISYSHIWRVPVLHFTVQLPDGTPRSRQDVIADLLSYSADPDSSMNVTSDFVSIDEHPITGLPSYLLHPCQTTSLLETLGASSTSAASRLWSWMSMILPHVGILISPSTFCRIQKELEKDDAELIYQAN